MIADAVNHRALSVAFGPALPGWGSWDWVGADTCGELARWFRTSTFGWGELPESDVVVIVKHLLPPEQIAALARRAAVIYCPIDFYDSAAAIAQDAASLRRCARIVIHCERLRRWFEPYSTVVYLDHHVKYASPAPTRRVCDGFVLWAGVRSNLGPLVEWVNAHGFDEPLRILTNLEDPDRACWPSDWGFLHAQQIRIEPWTPERHRHYAALAKGAIDIKGRDFRQQHKPPTKALDYLASGLPLAMNSSSSTDHLECMGFDVCSPFDTSRWFSQNYWHETVAFGAALRELLTLAHLGRRWRRLILDVLPERDCGDAAALGQPSRPHPTFGGLADVDGR